MTPKPKPEEGMTAERIEADVNETREILAAYAHEAWAGWMKYLFNLSTHAADGSVLIPAKSANRWKRQARTAYRDLPPEEKKSDLDEADKIINISARTDVPALCEALRVASKLIEDIYFDPEYLDYSSMGNRMVDYLRKHGYIEDPKEQGGDDVDEENA